MASPKKGEVVYVYEDEELEEVQVSDDLPVDDANDDDDDDASTVWTDDGSEMINDLDMVETADNEDTMDEEIEDMSLCVFNGHSDSVYCAAVAKQNGLVITGGGDDKAYLWKYTKGCTTVDPSLVFELSGHTDTVTSVGFNYDNTLVLTGAYDGTVKVWQVSTGELKLTLEGPEDVEWANWHGKGNAIIAGSRDGTIWMWLVQGGQCVQVFAGHDGGVTSGCFTSDGKSVCSGGDDGTIRIWGPKTGQCKQIFDGFSGHEATVTCLQSAPFDEDLLLSGSVDGTMKLIQISGKRLLHSFNHSVAKTQGTDGSSAPNPSRDADDGGEALSSVECVGFSNKQWYWCASGGLDNSLKVWDMAAGSCRCVCAHNGSVVSLQWHSVAPIIVSAALDKLVRIWDARSGNLLQSLSGHRDAVTSIEMSPLVPSDDPSETDTDVIVSVSDDKTSRVFHINYNALLLR